VEQAVMATRQAAKQRLRCESGDEADDDSGR
jgi:hypothetical protein